MNGLPDTLRVLVVDDDEDDFLITRDLLGEMGGRSVTLEWERTYEAGLAATRRGGFDVALLDYRLGERDGVQLVRDAIASGCTAPLILLTGQESGDVDLQALRAGAADYLQKRTLDTAPLERAIRYAVERQRAAAALRDSEERFRLAFDSSAVGMALVDLDGGVLRANAALVEMLGTTSETLVARTFDQCLHPDERAEDARQMRRLLLGEIASCHRELRLVGDDGRELPAQVSRGLVRDAIGEPLHVVAQVQDLTERKALEERLRAASLRDPLTGCFNRRYLSGYAEELEARGETRWGCLYVDVDHFKQYNDAHGHRAGDAVLVRLSRFLMRQVRPEDPVVRVGGDEFVVVLPGADAAATAMIATRIRDAALQAAPVSFSLGWTAREAAEPLARSLDRADLHMYAVRVEARSGDRR